MNDFNDEFNRDRDLTRPYHPKNLNNEERKTSGRAENQQRRSAQPVNNGRPNSGSYRGSARRTSSRRRSRRVKASPLFSMLFFPCAVFYHELLLRIFDRDTAFFGLPLLRILLFSLSSGLALFLLLDLIPNKKVSRWIGGIVSFGYIVILCVERGMKGMFGMYYGVLAAAGTAGDAVGNFAEGTKSAVINIIPFIFLSLIPFLLFLLARRAVFHERGQRWPVRALVAVLLLVAHFSGVGLCQGEKTKAIYTTDFNMISGIPEFGLTNSIRLELQYAIFGMPEADMSSFFEDPPTYPTNGNTTDPSDPTGPADPSSPTGPEDPSGFTEPTEPPRVYGPQVIDSIDFETLANSTSDKTLKSMHQYFGSLTPSMENEYTGLFEGKNLILICAESFDDYVIDPELTPTLYRMTQLEGFVFTNFYQPDWTLSTCGGEFSVTTGLIPNWIGKSDSARQAIDNAMPTTLGNIFGKMGYYTPAWHNGNYTFYSRNKYLATFGYDYAGCGGGGLELPTGGWLASDKEMIEATADQYINKYLETGTPFHAYYMSVTGHGPWNFSNKWAAKYRDLVEEKYPGLSTPCLAYLAANIELDRALEVLVQKLEDAGIADDTLIVMAADHYPYYLCTGNSQQGDSTDYYNELNRYFGNPEDSEKVTSRYRNTLLMWSGSIQRTVVDTPCYSCDIVPTILNLFGIDYDSRLYSGRDIFDPNYQVDQYSSSMPLVIFANNKGQGNSWITAAGVYEASTKTFTPNPGVTVPDDYVKRVNNLVSGKLQNSKLIITQDYYAKVFK